MPTDMSAVFSASLAIHTMVVASHLDDLSTICRTLRMGMVTLPLCASIAFSSAATVTMLIIAALLAVLSALNMAISFWNRWHERRLRRREK